MGVAFMFHDTDDLERERQRVAVRPEAESAPPVLAVFDAVPRGPAREYAERLRAVMAPTLGIALTESFDGESVPAGTIPDWFRSVSADVRAGREAVPQFARSGRTRYEEEIEGTAWEIQDWLFRFDPESEFRGWAWWDVTRPAENAGKNPGEEPGEEPAGNSAENTVHVWVDSWGESFFGCDDLRWLLFTAGAEQVSGPRVAKAAEWARETPL
jgi:hypothetical protein